MQSQEFKDIFRKMTYAEIINLYKECKEEREPKKFNADKVFADTVKFYIDKKGYSLEQANDIAEKVVKQRREEYESKK